MKNLLPLFTFALFLLFHASSTAQDVTFSQWENMPLHFNPALTGDFDGLVRIRGKYRNQWSSILGDDAFKTSAVSAEYKFNKGESRKISLGFHSIFDNAGELNFRTKTFNLSSSVVQHLGDLTGAHHSIGIGLNAGIGNQKIDTDNFRWGSDNPFQMGPPAPVEELNSKVSFTDFSAGLVWNYVTTTRFSFQLGAAMHHINQPNLSFSQNDQDKLRHRYNLHGQVEIPVSKKLSAVPSFLFASQSSIEQLLFGLSGKYYFKSANANFLQLGLLGKTTDNFFGTRLNIFVLSATVEINSILIGFSYDHFDAVLNSKAYEFSVGYTIGNK